MSSDEIKSDAIFSGMRFCLEQKQRDETALEPCAHAQDEISRNPVPVVSSRGLH